MMMVQALNSPISFLSVTRSEAPGPGPGPGEGEGAGPAFPRPLGCCVGPAISLSSCVPAPCAVPSIRLAACPSVRPSVGKLTNLAALAARTALTGGRMRWRGARAVGPGRRGPGRGGRRAGRHPSPAFLKGNSPRGPSPQSWPWGRARKSFVVERRKGPSCCLSYTHSWGGLGWGAVGEPDSKARLTLPSRGLRTQTKWGLPVGRDRGVPAPRGGVQIGCRPSPAT